MVARPGVLPQTKYHIYILVTLSTDNKKHVLFLSMLEQTEGESLLEINKIAELSHLGMLWHAI